MANNSTLITIRNEVGGLETIDTAWDPDTRIWYDAMAAAGMRRTFPETAAFDVLVKAMKTLAPPLAARVGDVLTVLPNKTWGAQPLPEDAQMREDVNTALSAAENAVTAASQAASDAANAATSAENAATSAENASSAADTAGNAATLAGQSAFAASGAATQAAQAATNAATDAANAATEASNAATSATNALSVANAAQAAATTAANLAADVAAYAGTIDTKAISANNKADTNATNLAALTTDFNFATKNITEFVASSIWNTSGVIASNASFKRTAKYRTQKDAQFKVPAGQTGVVAQAVFWKADGTLLSTVQNQSTTITAPPNAYYVAFSVLNAATDIKVSGGFWSLQQQDNNLLFEYTHSGNKEVNITSIDFATNTFTSPNHGLANTTNAVLTSRIGIAIKTNVGFVIPQNVTPFSSYPSVGFYVINATANTFQLSTTEGGAPIALVNKGTLDLSKWHFEQGNTHSILFSDFIEKRVRILVEGGICLGYSFYMGSPSSQTYYKEGATSLGYANSAFPLPLAVCKIEAIEVDASGNAAGSKIVQADGIRFNTAVSTISRASERDVFLTNSAWTQARVGASNMLLANGTTIRIYKY